MEIVAKHADEVVCRTPTIFEFDFAAIAGFFQNLGEPIGSATRPLLEKFARQLWKAASFGHDRTIDADQTGNM